MIGWILAGATAAVLASSARSRARRARLSRARRRIEPIANTWRATLRYLGPKGEEQVDIGNRDGGYTYARMSVGWPAYTRDPKSLENLIELTADTIAERIEPSSTIVLELWRSTIEGAVARIELGPAAAGQGGQLIAQAQASFAGATGGRTQNYAGADIGELALRFVKGQLRTSWEEGYFA